MALEDGGSFIFGGNTGLSYEQLKQRRAIAQALASRNQGFPKTKGEGMTYLGQSIAEAMGDLGLQRREAEYRAKQSAALGTLRSPAAAPQQRTDVQPPPGQPPVAPVVAPVTPPVTPPPVAAAPPPPAPVAETPVDISPAAMAGNDPDVPAMPAPALPVDVGESWSPDKGVVAAPPPTPPPPVMPQGPPLTTVPPVSVDPNAAAPLSGGTLAPGDLSHLSQPSQPSQASPVRDKIAAAMVAQPRERPQLPSEKFLAATTPAEADAALGRTPEPVQQLPPIDPATLQQPEAPTGPPPGAAPTPAPDVPLPRGNPRTTSGVRATMEAALSRGGQSPAAIAGIERNVADESGFNPNLRHPDQPKFSGEAHFAHGLYQEGGDEWNNYVAWIDKNAPGSDWRDPNLQSRFLADRLQDPQYARTNAEMNRPDTSPSGAAISFLQGYLKPADQYMAQRTEKYAREGGDSAYANRQVAQGGDAGDTTVGPRVGGGGGREGGEPADDTRDLVTQALLEQPQQRPQDTAQPQSQDYLPDIAGMTNRSVLPQRPTAALGRAGVASDVSLGALPPMGALGGPQGPPSGTPAGSPPGSPGSPPGSPGSPPGSPPLADPRDAVTQALLSQQGPGAMDQGAGLAATQSPTAAAAQPATMTDIQQAPIGAPGQQLAQATPPPIPDPLSAPVPRQVPGVQAQPSTPPQFAQPPIAPQPPPIPPMSADEQRIQRTMAQFPDDPTVQARGQKALDDAEKQRLLPYQRDIEKYKADLGLYNEQYKAWQENIRKQPLEDIAIRKGQEELAKAQAERERTTRLGGVNPAFLEAEIAKSAEQVKALPASQQGLANARSSLDANMFTGSAANIQLNLAKWMHAAGMPLDPSVPPTEAFRAYMANVTAQARQALVGGAQISNADLKAAERASAGDITYEPESIRKVLDSLERINTATAVNHQSKLLGYTGDDPNAQRVVFGTFGLPMENIVPPTAQKLLRDNPTPEVMADFDRTFKTPGLAARILARR